MMVGGDCASGDHVYGRTVSPLFRVGLVGSLVTALCCVGVLTPPLVALLTAVGLGVLTRNLDLVLFPTLAVFLLLTAAGWWLRSRRRVAASEPSR